MPRVLSLTRRLPREVWFLRRFSGRNGQGAPTYLAPVEFEAHVVEGDVVATRGMQRELVLMPEGTDLRVSFTLYVPGDVPFAATPAAEDEIILPPGFRFSCRESTAKSGLRWLRSGRDHTVVVARLERFETFIPSPEP
jgi:hypothetical protein